MSTQEYFGIEAELNKDTPKNIAETLRAIANELESAPENRRYDLTLETTEYIVKGGSYQEKTNLAALHHEIQSLKAEIENIDISTTTESEPGIEQSETPPSEMSYNELKEAAAKHGLKMRPTPTKTELIETLKDNV